MSRPRDPVARRVRRTAEERLADLERSLADLTARLREVESIAKPAVRTVRRLERHDAMVRHALGFRKGARKGESGHLAVLNETVLRLEEYLLRTNERIDNVLKALKNHREFLVKLNRRVFTLSTRDRIRMELDVMRNTVWILALSGVEVDRGLTRDLEKLRREAGAAEDLALLRKSKELLDKRFEEELQRFDLNALTAKRKHLPGYG